MLTRLLVPMIAGLTVVGVAQADDPVDGDLVAMDARYIFAPVGFDDNDEAMVVVDGYLPSGCYRLTRPELNIDPETRKITVTPMARFFDVPCIEALVPYSQEIRLGVLPQGDYSVTVKDGSLTESMSVGEATSAGPDDYLYAAIDAAEVDKPDDSDKHYIKLQGRFTNSCMVLDQVKVIDTGKTINVLPIMSMRDADDCVATELPFRRMIELPATVTEGRHLLHVRSLNGQAVNHLFYK